MIEIDGGYGEGGGQIFRTALTLSILTGKPVRIANIRAGRKSPGLKPQHRMSAQSAARISNGRLEGGEVGSKEVRFHPGPIEPGDHLFDVGTAGAVTLVFQTLLWPLGFSDRPSRLILKGGTHVAWSPPADYLREVFLPVVSRMGVRAEARTDRWGFYPIGGGTVEGRVEPFAIPLKPIRIEDRGKLIRLHVLSTVSHLPTSIGQRQRDRAVIRLREAGFDAEGESRAVDAPGKGTFCFILAEFQNIRGGFSALGAIGKRAEEVADEAVEAFLRYDAGTGAVDPHLVDQIVLPMALADGESSMTMTEVTDHLRTNLWVVEHFLRVKIDLREGPAGKGGTLFLKGAALRRLPES